LRFAGSTAQQLEAKKVKEMDQEALKTSLNGLERKILVLLNEHKSLKDELRGAKTENQDLRNSLKSREEQLSNFKNQIKITKIVDYINPDDGSASELKRKVDDYIREVDKCIAYLSR
jgi:chromosome segregation ATPase